jgi:hypothetical protein
MAKIRQKYSLSVSTWLFQVFNKNLGSSSFNRHQKELLLSFFLHSSSWNKFVFGRRSQLLSRPYEKDGTHNHELFSLSISCKGIGNLSFSLNFPCHPLATSTYKFSIELAIPVDCRWLTWKGMWKVWLDIW